MMFNSRPTCGSCTFHEGRCAIVGAFTGAATSVTGILFTLATTIWDAKKENLNETIGMVTIGAGILITTVSAVAFSVLTSKKKSVLIDLHNKEDSSIRMLQNNDGESLLGL
ncbi:hypothetical protein PHSC3_000037 [Chlamydiales bacterium STE3]|nr:hypothetical protein PHSC3_000037 [Chlamydiales bacterium STE3]